MTLIFLRLENANFGFTGMQLMFPLTRRAVATPPLLSMLDIVPRVVAQLTYGLFLGILFD
jgi:hypothetical protein